MNDSTIKVLGESISKVLFALAALVGAWKTPEAISNYSVNVKTESIVNNTISSISKIVNNNSNNMKIQFIQYSQRKLQGSLENPAEFKKEVELLPASVLTTIGLNKSKAEFESQVKNVNTKEELRQLIKKELPDLLLNQHGKPFTLDKDSF